MVDIREILKVKHRYYGVDTETYNTPSYGLKSIQVSTSNQDWYFTVDDWEQSDNDIRFAICSKFVDWLNGLDHNATLGFFNINYDFSQMAYFFVNKSGYKYVEHSERLFTKQLRILESDRQLYKVEMLNPLGKRIIMVDIANFLTATNLNKACKDWIGKEKLDIESKDFLKASPTEKERDYAIQDSRLTYELLVKLYQESVIERGTVTIAGRTIKHFKDYLKVNYGLTFERWAWGTDDKDLIAEYSEIAEQCLRDSTRGGICQAVHTGIFENCKHIDARSMYPTQMILPWIPNGQILTSKPEAGHFTIYYPIGCFELKPDKIPYLQFRRKSQCQRYQWIEPFDPGEYPRRVYLDGSYALWEQEIELILENYDTYHLNLDKQCYVCKTENRILKPYIDELYTGKQTNTGTKQYYYKILLNSLYGKFLSRPDGVIISYSNGYRHKEEDIDRPTYYLPLGMFIAMMGRVTLVKTMNTLPFDDVLYCDTDSIIYKGENEPTVTMGKCLGDWAIENVDFTANVIGAKTYQELCNDGKTITKCAGLSHIILPTVKFGDLQIGSEYDVIKSERDNDIWAINLKKTKFKVTDRVSVLRGH